MALYLTPRDVPIAEYLYRHEAEFAAGLMKDAGIPFRLQTDDAGGADAFMTVARPARLWVRAEDVEKVREVLEIPLNSDLSQDSSSEPAVGAAASSPLKPEQPDTSRTVLSGQERLLAGTLSIAFLAVSLGIAPLDMSAGLTVVSFVLALIFGIAMVFGRSVGPFRLALRVLSGHVP